MRTIFTTCILTLCFSLLSNEVNSQHSIAREWNEALLESIRGDFARPTVHARNLWHSSAMMYDIWAVFDDVARPYFLGNEVNGFVFEFNGFDTTADQETKIEEAISHAMFNLIAHRFENSPGSAETLNRITDLMDELGYDHTFTDTDYSSGNAAAFGNFLAQSMIAYGLQDGSREATGYDNAYYTPSNTPLVIQNPGNPILENPNNWQQLTLDVFIDQSGNEIPFNTPDFLSPEWGNVDPFSLTDDDLTTYVKNGSDEYKVYLDPGAPPFIDLNDPEASYDYIRGFELVLKWSSQLDPADGKMVDISPASNGNNPPLPESASDILSYYDYENGGDFSQGHEINPATGSPYLPQMVPFGDYTRVLAEFWADGPDSETPPGHWFSILNFVNDHPLNPKQFEGTGDAYDDLEWDIKSYFTLGGAMHDAAIAAWGVKGYYDYIRPVSAIRYIAQLGQRSDPNLPNYSPFGFELVEGFVELVGENDPLVGDNLENLNKLKANVWRGPDFINDPETDKAGVGWILIENWWPYQRPSFVTPPFAGYVSGHSTYSRAAAEVLTKFTGNAYFPGGMGIFVVEENEFLVFEEGPSESFFLQWATYRDASDETSLSRIWGGIHPPADDIPGRIMGIQIADRVFDKAQSYFFKDEDGDGFYNFEDCDDLDASVNPLASELCDDIDNDCNGDIDDGLALFTYYLDADGDGFGNSDDIITICADEAPQGYSAAASDCDDQNADINPLSPEICDDIDNDCNGDIDDGLVLFTYYLDADGDGFGNSDDIITICANEAPQGYSATASDCDDQNADINPLSPEICDDIDNDCNGDIDDGLVLFTYYLDADGDGFGNSNEIIIICADEAPQGYSVAASDCDDQNADINPLSPEICDDIDNDCNGDIDDNIPYYSYYVDNDGDGYGNADVSISICDINTPEGYSVLDTDCDDQNPMVNPMSTEVCDNIDNDCNGEIDDTIPYFFYYRDNDGDGFGDPSSELFVCDVTPPLDHVTDNTDCDDDNDSIYPGAPEISDNGIDEDCNGLDLFELTKVFPNPFNDVLTIHINQQNPIRLLLVNSLGQLIYNQAISGSNNVFTIDNITEGSIGVFYLYLFDESGEMIHSQQLIRI